jgi:hypothetical protein
MKLLLVMAAVVLVAMLASCTAITKPFCGEPEGWSIGPVIACNNSSEGMPDKPTPTAGGFRFDFPQRGGSVHYVTKASAPITASAIRIRYRITAAEGVRFVPSDFPDRQALVTLYFQRQGDNWDASSHETYRWFSTIRMPLDAGDREWTMSLEPSTGWKAVGSTYASQNPTAFATAKRDAARVGVVFGSNGGAGHGVYATGPAAFELLEWEMML